MSNEDEARQILQESGLRATSQRRTIIEVIEKHDGHLTAEEVYQEAKQLNPHVSMTTVYRTLAVLKKAGVIEQRYLTAEHDRSHFALAGTATTFHFHCLGCGKIVEFESAEIRNVLARDLENKHQAQVTQAYIGVEGYCAACRQVRTGEGELPR